MHDAPYQLLPPLSAEDYAALKASIAREGVLIPVEVDETGNIIDGHHRVKICQELGISDWPVVVREGLDRSQKRAIARQLNIARRHLTTALKRVLIRQQLEETPYLSNRGIGAILGVEGKTVDVVRRDMLASGKIPATPKRLGQNGKYQPAEKPQANDPWKGLRLSSGRPIAGIGYSEIDALIRDMQRDIGLLRKIKGHSIPFDADATIRDLVKPSTVHAFIGRGATDE